MKRKDIEKAFAQLSLEEMNPLLDALTQLRHTKREARVKELQDEIARLNAFGGGGDVVGNGRTAGPRVGNGRRAARDSGISTNGLTAGKRASPQPKYRGPNGETWAGRGGTPRWMADLIAKGKKKEDFLIKG